MDKEYLKQAAKAVEETLPDNHSFIIMAVPNGNDEGARVSYISSMKRESAIGVIKTILFQWGEKANWMKHIK